MKSKLMTAAFTGLVLALNANAVEKTKSSAESTVTGECHGMNTCKGQGECGGQGHECAGKNTCKGKGWKTLTEKECEKKKGQWKKASAMKGSDPTELEKETPNLKK